MNIEYKEIILKPVVRAKFAGISGHSNTVTALEGAQIDKSGYKTGLTVEEEKMYEKELNLAPHTLSKRSDFWSTILNLRIPNDKAYHFIVSSALDQLKLKVLLNRGDIAANELELAKNPRAIFYIEDREAKAKVEEVTINFKMEAMEILTSLGIEEKRGYLKLYGKRGVDQLSETIIKTELYKEIETNPKKFIEFTKNPDIKLRISIEDMLEAGTITKRGSYYNFEEEVIGNSIDAVISFFKDYKNQSVKIAAENDAKQKNKGK